MNELLHNFINFVQNPKKHRINERKQIPDKCSNGKDDPPRCYLVLSDDMGDEPRFMERLGYIGYHGPYRLLDD